jgi:leader peptidase (prepilin peptidase) / N-methyltransferase
LEIILDFILFLLGISIGSFLNVVADRIPMGKSILSPPSHCFGCGRELESRDLIPVVSYLLLKGRCRYCHAQIPVRSMLVELVTGLIFVVAWLTFGPTWPMIESLAYISMMVVLVITTLENDVVPARIVYPEVGVALLIAAANSFIKYEPGLISALTGLAIGSAVMLVLWGISRLPGRRILDYGYFGMAALVGASTGYPFIVIATCLALPMWAVTGLILLILKTKKISAIIPPGLFIAAAGIGTIIWGKQLLNLVQFFVVK